RNQKPDRTRHVITNRSPACFPLNLCLNKAGTYQTRALNRPLLCYCVFDVAFGGIGCGPRSVASSVAPVIWLERICAMAKSPPIETTTLAITGFVHETANSREPPLPSTSRTTRATSMPDGSWKLAVIRNTPEKSGSASNPATDALLVKVTVSVVAPCVHPTKGVKLSDSGGNDQANHELGTRRTWTVGSRVAARLPSEFKHMLVVDHSGAPKLHLPLEVRYDPTGCMIGVHCVVTWY